MGGRKNLRRRFRDESTIANLMEVPTWLFFSLMVVAAMATLLIGAIVDIATKRIDVFLTALVPLVVVAFFGGLFWLSTRERLLRRRRLLQVSTAHQLLALMPDEMADVAAELYRLQGYVITENKRPDLPDGGVDFEVAQRGKTWLVQVKHWRQEVTVKEARELWGIVASEGAAGGILIGTSGFTAATREFASGKDLTLLDGPEFMTLRSQLAQIDKSRIGASDPLVSDGFALHLAGIHRPACPKCGKPMLLVSRLEDTVVIRQFWGCRDYPSCDGTRRFAFPYLPVRGSEADPVARTNNWSPIQPGGSAKS